MSFRIPINVEKLKDRITHHVPVLMLGSCFTDNIGSRMKRYMFDVTVNPFGVIYNPLSVKKALDQLISRERYTIEDLNFHNELWFSFDHYTKYSSPVREEVLDSINKEFSAAKGKLASAGFLLITFGTAYAYRYMETGEVVCNCHKIPASKFDRQMLSVETIVEEYSQLIMRLQEINPDLQMIFTVSPVRHLKDGANGNQLSKATLLLSIAEIINRFPGSAHYFPAYEIVMDDLRDYRFYDSDMVHPNEQAIGYIWDKFQEAAIDDQSRTIIKEIDPLIKARDHKPLHKDTKAYLQFLEALRKKEQELTVKYPFLPWQTA